MWWAIRGTWRGGGRAVRKDEVGELWARVRETLNEDGEWMMMDEEELQARRNGVQADEP